MVGITEVMSISIVSIEGISISLWLSISRSLAIVGITVVGIWVSIVSMVGITKVGSITIVSVVGISIWLSISRSLSIVGITVVGIWVSIVSMVGITKVMSIAIVAIESISISLWLGFSSNSCEHAEGGNGL